jgi:4-carboxymuconolactone decarboxylase
MNMEMRNGLAIILLAGMAAMLGAGASHAQTPAPSADAAATSMPAAGGVGAQTATRGANTAAAPLPKDIDPESRNRLPVPRGDGLSDNDKRIFDAMTHGQPASVRLYSPKLAQTLGDAQNYLKSETGFGDQLTEIAVLVASREMDSQFLWTIWEKHGRDLKDSRHIDAGIIDVIKYEKPVAGLGEKEALVITFGRELLGQKKVSPETFAQAVRLFGRRGTVDLVELFFQWSATATELVAFEQQLPEGQRPFLPPR